MLLWGWRIPFLLSLPIFATALLLRTYMRESDEFLASKAAAGGAALAPEADPDAKAASGTAPLLAGGSGDARAARCGCAGRVPLLRLFRTAGLGFALDMVYVAWLVSTIYVVYAKASVLRQRLAYCCAPLQFCIQGFAVVQFMRACRTSPHAIDCTHFTHRSLRTAGAAPQLIRQTNLLIGPTALHTLPITTLHTNRFPRCCAPRARRRS